MQRQPNHTPGPWEIGQYPWLIQEFEKDGVEGEVAQVNSHRTEFEANARLIAAAPDLLAALKLIDLYDTEVRFVLGTDACDAIVGAFEKAEGRDNA